jgi:hypothetical protein
VRREPCRLALFAFYPQRNCMACETEQVSLRLKRRAMCQVPWVSWLRMEKACWVTAEISASLVALAQDFVTT